ncbi:unnamed protein product, partial [Nesidiocoris tenuis]
MSTGNKTFGKEKNARNFQKFISGIFDLPPTYRVYFTRKTQFGRKQNAKIFEIFISGFFNLQLVSIVFVLLIDFGNRITCGGKYSQLSQAIECCENVTQVRLTYLRGIDASRQGRAK